MDKFSPTEIGNPKKTAARRMAAAEEGSAPPPKAQPPASGMSQSDFGAGGPSVRNRDDPKRAAKLAEMMRRHQAP